MMRSATIELTSYFIFFSPFIKIVYDFNTTQNSDLCKSIILKFFIKHFNVTRSILHWGFFCLLTHGDLPRTLGGRTSYHVSSLAFDLTPEEIAVCCSVYEENVNELIQRAINAENLPEEWLPDIEIYRDALNRRASQVEAVEHYLLTTSDDERGPALHRDYADSWRLFFGGMGQPRSAGSIRTMFDIVDVRSRQFFIDLSAERAELIDAWHSLQEHETSAEIEAQVAEIEAQLNDNYAMLHGVTTVLKNVADLGKIINDGNFAEKSLEMSFIWKLEEALCTEFVRLLRPVILMDEDVEGQIGFTLNEYEYAYPAILEVLNSPSGRFNDGLLADIPLRSSLAILDAADIEDRIQNLKEITPDSPTNVPQIGVDYYNNFDVYDLAEPARTLAPQLASKLRQQTQESRDAAAQELMDELTASAGVASEPAQILLSEQSHQPNLSDLKSFYGSRPEEIISGYYLDPNPPMELRGMIANWIYNYDLGSLLLGAGLMGGAVSYQQKLLTIKPQSVATEVPVVMQQVSQFPSGISEAPVIVGPRGRRVVSPEELRDLIYNPENYNPGYYPPPLPNGQFIDIVTDPTIHATTPPDLDPLSKFFIIAIMVGLTWYFRNELMDAVECWAKEKTFSELYADRAAAEAIRKQQQLLQQQQAVENIRLEKHRDFIRENFQPKLSDKPRSAFEIQKEEFLHDRKADLAELQIWISQIWDFMGTHKVIISISVWYIGALILYYILLDYLFDLKKIKKRFLFWRLFQLPDPKEIQIRSGNPAPWLAKKINNFATLITTKWDRFKLTINKMYHHILYSSKPYFLIFYILYIVCAYIACYFLTNWEVYHPDPDAASGQYYIIDDETWRWSRLQQNLALENLESDIYGKNLWFAHWFEPQYILYPEGTDIFATTNGFFAPDKPMTQNFWPKFWALQLDFGMGEVYINDEEDDDYHSNPISALYTDDEEEGVWQMMIEDRYNDYWCISQHYGEYRYIPYSSEIYDSFLKPSLIHGQLKFYLGLPLIIMNLAIIWWNFWNPRLSPLVDVENPDNLLSGPDRVYLNETQQKSIETDEIKIYAEKMDKVIAVWKLKGWAEDEPRTLAFIISASGTSWTEARQEAAEKYWLPYTRNRDREGNPRRFNARDRGQDRAYVWQCITADRTAWRKACTQARKEQWEPYQILLDKIKTERGLPAYYWNLFICKRTFEKKLILPVYKSKWEELVQDDPHPDDDHYGN